MNIRLAPNEARVIGCLLEKQRTTPEHYPLSLNSLTNACNQKSNRDPVLELDESTVHDTIETLINKGHVSEKAGFGSRVKKYQHRFCNTEFGTLKFSEQEVGIICMLLLRGPQTLGELRTRTERLCSFKDINDVESTLDLLSRREDGPFVTKLTLEPGKREARFAHRFGLETERHDAAEPAQPLSTSPETWQVRIERLEETVNQLRDEVNNLRTKLDQIASD